MMFKANTVYSMLIGDHRVVCRVVVPAFSFDNNDGFIELSHPKVMMEVPTQNGIQVGLLPFLAHKEVLNVRASSIVAWGEADDQLASLYIQSVSGLTIPSSEVVNVRDFNRRGK